MVSVLIGSPIRQKPNILKQFLNGLDGAEKKGLEIYYCFVDDNKESESSMLLNEFARDHKVLLLDGNEIIDNSIDNNYVCDDDHHWRSENIQRITKFKDRIIEYCLEQRFDYLFFVDSDIVLDNRTLTHLISKRKEIVSNVFWTQWQVNSSLSPQCFWIPDLYQQNTAFNVKMPPEEANRIRKEMVDRLHNPGVYHVDGLGACTMIARSALEKGVRFKEIPNLSVPGEDRHFCVRAGALGIDLYMDTTYPVYHIYREEYLDRVDEFKRDGWKFDMCQTVNEELEKPAIRKTSFFIKVKRKVKRVFKHK